MGLLETAARAVLAVCMFVFHMVFRGRGYIPAPSLLLHRLLDLRYGTDKLKKLEYLTDLYSRQGLFRYDNKVYIFDPKLTQTAVNKLEKGAEEYLKNSPLKDTFLGSSSRSPEVRRAIAAIFRRGNIEERGGEIISDVKNMCDRMEKQAALGCPVNVTEWTLRMALDVVGHVLLQLDMHALEGSQERLLHCLVTILHRCYALAEIAPESEEFQKASRDFETMTSQILTAALKQEDKGSEKRLVVTLHEACGFDLARDNMKLFLMAGSETTAATIPVLFYLLATYPDVQEELRQEADENMSMLEHDPATVLPKTEAVLREVLRVYPIAPFISRRTYEAVTVGDITLQPNTDIIAFTWGIHRSPNQWEDSKHFQPFRFMAGSSKPGASMYMPFGAGSRICIGQHLALLELKLATAFMLHRFKFSKLPETPELKFVVDWAHAVVHPDKDMVFKLDPR